MWVQHPCLLSPVSMTAEAGTGRHSNITHGAAASHLVNLPWEEFKKNVGYCPHWGHHNKTPETGWLKQQTFPQFWRLAVWAGARVVRLVRAAFLACRWPRSCSVSHRGRKERASPPAFVPSGRPRSWPHLAPMASQTPISSYRCLGSWGCNLGILRGTQLSL